MRLTRPPERYSRSSEAQRNLQLEQADRKNRKKGADVELGDGERLVLRSPDGTRWALTVDNTGALGTEAL